MNKHFRRLQEADYVPVSLNDKEMMDPSSLSLKSVAKRNKDDADRAEAEAAKKTVRAENAKKYSEVEAILNQTLDKDKQPSDVLDAVFDTGIVPGSGKADTKAGEIIRAMMRIIYRYYNDGDKFFEGYGLETAAPSVAYLMDTIDEVATYVANMFDKLYNYESDAKYNDAIETLADICLHHVQAHFEELMDPNEEDSRDWSSSTLDEIEENQPKYEYDVWGSDDIIVLVENGVLNAWDLKEYVEDMLQWEQAFKDAEVDRPWSHSSTELNITNLTKDGYELIRDWFHNREEQFWSELVEQYRDELDAIYNEDSEDESDEDIDESLKEAKYDGVETKLRRLMDVYEEEDDGDNYELTKDGDEYEFSADWDDIYGESYTFYIDNNENWRLFKFDGWWGDDAEFLHIISLNDALSEYSRFFTRSQLAYLKRYARKADINLDAPLIAFFSTDIYEDESRLNPFWTYGHGWKDLIGEISDAYPMLEHYDYLVNGDKDIDESKTQVKGKKLTEKSRNPQIRKIEIDLAKELGKNNLKLNPEEIDLETAAEYIYMATGEGEYTVQDWIKDTKENYPECFLNESKKLKEHHYPSTEKIECERCGKELDDDTYTLYTNEHDEEEIVCHDCRGKLESGKSVKEAYKSNYELARPNSSAILNALDNGLTNPTTLILQLLKWIPDDTLKGFVEFYGYGGHDNDEELDEDIKLVFKPEFKKG